MTIFFSANKPHLKPIKINKDDARSLNLMALLLRENHPVASSCKGDGICSKCRVNVLTGSSNLIPKQNLEEKTIAKNRVTASERLACQAYLQGDVTIDTNYW